jgi:hypothetical protein
MTNILHVELAIDFLANEHILFSFAKNELVNKLSAIYERSTFAHAGRGIYTSHVCSYGVTKFTSHVIILALSLSLLRL